MTIRACYSNASTPRVASWLVRAVVICCFGLTLGLGVIGAGVSAAEKPNLEDKVKAALTYKFPRYVAWPDQRHTAPDDPVVFGVAGDRAVYEALIRSVVGAKIRGRPVQIRWFTNAEDLAACHVVFLGREFSQTSPTLLEHLARESVLTVGDSDRFCEQGGSIRLYRDGGKIRFLIRRSVTRRARLKVSSKLLRLGSIFEEPK